MNGAGVGSGAGELGGGESTVRVNFWLAVPPMLSAAVTVKGKVPAAVGVPFRTPALFRVSPSRLPVALKV